MLISPNGSEPQTHCPPTNDKDVVVGDGAEGLVLHQCNVALKQLGRPNGRPVDVMGPKLRAVSSPQDERRLLPRVRGSAR